MGDSLDTDLLMEISGETSVAAVHLDEATGDFTPPDSDPDLIASKTLTVIRDWVQPATPPTWSEYAGLSPELHSWHLQLGNLSLDLAGRLWRCRAPPATSLQLVVPPGECRVFIQRYHDSVFASHSVPPGLFAICWIVFIGQDCVMMSDPIWLAFLSLGLQVSMSPSVSHGRFGIWPTLLLCMDSASSVSREPPIARLI